MKLLEFSFKNIFSYGNKLQTFTIKQDQADLVLIHGKRGGGKSSIKESIILSAYGKSPNRSLKNIPNRQNKNAYLSTKFISPTGDVIDIERGISPNFLKLKINGETPPELPSKTKLDEYIENSLINIPFNVFCNTITISVNDFKSFVSLAPIDKRKIVDKIFGVGEINDMNVLNKLDIQKYQQKIGILDLSIQRNEEMITNTKFQLESLKNEIKESNTAQLEELKKKLIDLEEEQLIAKEQYQTYSPIITSLTEELNGYNEDQSKHRFNISEISKKLAVYEKNKCPHCLSDLTDTCHDTIKSKLVKMKTVLEDVLEAMVPAIQNTRQSLQENTTSQNKYKETFTNLKFKIDHTKRSIDNDFEETDNSLESSKLSELIKSMEEKNAVASVDREALRESMITHNELSKILAEDGMKKLFMAKIIPMINKNIIARCTEIEYPYSFEFDANFDPTITHLGHSIDLESLSTGEQKEMNLITLFCILDLIIAKMNLNFLFLDEVFTNLDSESIYKVVSMLRSFTDKHKITVFAISHDPLPSEFFDSELSIKKTQHHSDVVFSNSI